MEAKFAIIDICNINTHTQILVATSSQCTHTHSWPGAGSAAAAASCSPGPAVLKKTDRGGGVLPVEAIANDLIRRESTCGSDQPQKKSRGSWDRAHHVSKRIHNPWPLPHSTAN